MVGCCAIATVGVFTLLAYYVKKVYKWLFNVSEVPKPDENFWWGHGPPSSPDRDSSIKPFKVHFSEANLTDLKQRLSTILPFTPPIEGVQHQYGFNSNLLKDIKEFWINKYNWRERENFFNKYPQFTTQIQGLEICFVHVKPTETKGLKVVPIILHHGWPSSVLDFYEVIPLLTKPNASRNFIFEVVIPHLPGYGFSQAPVRSGLDAGKIAIIFKQLMERLEFKQWYVQGGDWGSAVSTQMALFYPEKVLGLHLNMAIVNSPMSRFKLLLGSLCPSLVVSEKHRSKLYPLKTCLMTLMRETGYLHIQATKPDTIGAALSDSPLGLAAYILEKFIAGTNKAYISREDGGLTLKFSYTRLLDTVMMYWISRSITTSMRLYAESFNTNNTFQKLERLPINVPTAYAHFGNDQLYTPEILLRDKFKNLLQFSELPTGGHFASLEEPELFAGDIWKAVEKFESYTTIVS